MPFKTRAFPILLLAVFAALRLPAQDQPAVPGKEKTEDAVLWRDPGDIAAKDLFHGPGGTGGPPRLPVKFIKEDEHGRNSKIDVQDAAGEKWRAKLGIEAQPETVAARLLWAVGFFTNENYFYPELTVKGLPAHLHRGQGHVIAPERLEGVRLQRHLAGEKKTDTWSWERNRFSGTREFNGLRVMMALISNWDLKDENNAVIPTSRGEEWLVTDVGTAFGASGEQLTEAGSKNNLKAYRHARFITKVTPEYVDFNLPQRPPLIFLLVLPNFIHQLHMRRVGHHIPRQDARWVGSLLAQLSEHQINEAFRAAGYSPQQIAAFTKALARRIADLNAL